MPQYEFTNIFGFRYYCFRKEKHTIPFNSPLKQLTCNAAVGLWLAHKYTTVVMSNENYKKKLINKSNNSKCLKFKVQVTKIMKTKL